MPRDVHSMIANNGMRYFCTAPGEDPPGEEDTEEVEIRPSIRITRTVLKALREEAKAAGMSVSDYVSDLVCREVG